MLQMESCSAEVRCFGLVLGDVDENLLFDEEDAYDDKRCPWLSALSKRAAALAALLSERYGAAFLAQEPDPLC